MPRPLSLAVLGAFPFPYPQGSQAYAADQVRALRAAGADATLIAYGRGAGAAPRDVPFRGGRFAPRRMRSGPRPAKALADAALLAALASGHRRARFDAVLAHNAEAALVALAARPVLRVPVVYVAHTLWGNELSAYGPGPLRRGLERAGHLLDSGIAARADAVLAVSRAGAEVLAPAARGPIEWIPPGLDPTPPPGEEESAAACADLGLSPGRFALYCGNLDPYQDLGALAEAAPLLASRGIAVLAATHDASSADRRVPGLWCVELAEAAAARALAHAAGVLVVPRRRAGGFPVKLLNYMETGRPIVAHRALAEGLEHGKSAWLLPRGAGSRELADACERLVADPAAAADLGRAARQHLESHHRWSDLAARTLDLAGRVIGCPPSARRRA